MGLLDDKEARQGVEIFSEITGLIVFPVIAGALVGRWLDSKYNSEPWFIIVGTAFGIIVASISIASLVKKYIKK